MEAVVANLAENPDFLLRTLNLYPHPSTSLWRAIEAREISGEFSVQHLDGPVLDLGCGDGRFSRATFESKKLDVGLDISSSALASARRGSNYYHVLAGDGTRLPFRDGTFETVLSNSVLEHIPNARGVLSETKRVLKPGGTLVFTVPSPNFLRFLFVPSVLCRIPLLRSFGDWYSRKRNALLSHNNICQLNVWRGWLETAGFQTVQGRSCLSKATLQVWDVMALIIYLFRIPLRDYPHVLSLSVSRSQKLRVILLGNILRRFYLSLTSDGADLIITAQNGQRATTLETHRQKS